VFRVLFALTLSIPTTAFLYKFTFCQLPGNDIHRGDDLVLLRGRFFQLGGDFIGEKIAPAAILFYQRGDIFKEAKLFCDTGSSDAGFFQRPRHLVPLA